MNNPTYFVYEATPNCNNNCVYCYNVWRERKDYPSGQLGLPQIKSLFAKLLKDIKPAGIALTGGEPMLRPDIYEIASLIKGLGVTVGIATNGTLLDEQKIKKLIDCGVSFFEISLVSLDKKRYSELSGNDKLAEVKRSILCIRKTMMPLTVSFTITKVNLGDISDFIDLCFAFSIKHVALNRFVPGGRGLDHLDELSINSEQLKSALKIADDKAAKYRLPISVTIPVEPCLINHKDYPHLRFGSCVCGKNKWAIDPAGNLRTCEQNPDIIGNLLEKSFSELSKTKGTDDFRNNNYKADCTACAEFKNCGGGCRFLRRNI